MSDLLSAQLLRELDEELSNNYNEDNPIIIGEIEVNHTMVPGLREGSSLVWAPDERNFYYKNAFSKATGLQACKCIKPGCKARLYIRENGTAFRKNGIDHAVNHGEMYSEYKLKYCFNKMKENAKKAPASMSEFDIYTEVVLE